MYKRPCREMTEQSLRALVRKVAGGKAKIGVWTPQIAGGSIRTAGSISISNTGGTNYELWTKRVTSISNFPTKDAPTLFWSPVSGVPVGDISVTDPTGKFTTTAHIEKIDFNATPPYLDVHFEIPLQSLTLGGYQNPYVIYYDVPDNLGPYDDVIWSIPFTSTDSPLDNFIS